MSARTTSPGPGDRREPCSNGARRRPDPLIASAPPTQRWLLLEVPAAWSEKVLNSRDIRGARETLAGIVERRHGRVLFVRRPGRRPTGANAPEGPAGTVGVDLASGSRMSTGANVREGTAGTGALDGPSGAIAPDGPAGAGHATEAGERTWVVVDAATGTESAGHWTSADGSRPADLKDAIAAFDSDGPLALPATTRLLVCTHGTHDQCCAVRGRPVAAALATEWPELVWECSHLGGDRFSGNLIVLPTGTYLGHLDAASANAVAHEELAGRTPPEHLRGVATQSPVVQAAVTEVLRVFGPYAAHLLRGRVVPPAASAPSTDNLASDEVEVLVTGHPRAERVRVRVTRVVLPPARRACLADIEKVAITHTAMLADGTDNSLPTDPLER